MKRRRLMYVRWVDSSLQNAQHDPADAPTPTEIESVGFLVVEDPAYLTLTRDIHDDGDHRGSLAIPRSAIVASQEIFTDEPNE